MRIPILRGLIDRRILVNFRVDADVLSGFLPPPFRPQLVAEGIGMAGICLIRLKGIRPRWLPSFLGIGSENAAHRIAVEWDDRGTTRTGVYIPRRDSSSYLNRLAGGRLFPGVHFHSRFAVHESAEEFRIEMANRDGTRILVEGRIAGQLPGDSIFGDLSRASDFFSRGSLGYSATGRAGEYDGLELHTLQWDVRPLSIRRVESSFFADRSLFPPGTVHFDCALLMRHIPHEWHGVETLTCCVTANR
ncbi:MAG: DUF2071 domain-containing protein [Deltaproteobacteria bacterium]